MLHTTLVMDSEDITPSTPVTPVVSQTETFSSISQSQHIQFTSSRRPSIATCSSNSSLYDVSLNLHDAGDDTLGSHSNFYSDDDAFLYDEDEADSTDTETLNSILPRSLRSGKTLLLSATKSSELFGKNWKDPSETTKSPTYFKAKRTEYFSSPKESTPIFKRMVNKNSLKPQLKSFKRITTELQRESDVLQNEINHEKLILLNLKDDERLLGSGFSVKNNKTDFEHETLSLKKFDIIRRANEAWNQKKNGNILREKSKNKLQGGSKEHNKLIRKRSNDESSSNFKRRAVSTSPSSASFFNRGNLKITSNASKDLEKMTFK